MEGAHWSQSKAKRRQGAPRRGNQEGRRQTRRPETAPPPSRPAAPEAAMRRNRARRKLAGCSRALLTGQRRTGGTREANHSRRRGRPECRQRAGRTQRDANGASMAEGSYREASPAKLVPSSFGPQVSRTRPSDRQTHAFVPQNHRRERGGATGALLGVNPIFISILGTREPRPNRYHFHQRQPPAALSKSI